MKDKVYWMFKISTYHNNKFKFSETLKKKLKDKSVNLYNM